MAATKNMVLTKCHRTIILKNYFHMFLSPSNIHNELPQIMTVAEITTSV